MRKTPSTRRFILHLIHWFVISVVFIGITYYLTDIKIGIWEGFIASMVITLCDTSITVAVDKVILDEDND